MGLFDAVGDLHEVLRTRHGADIELRVIEAKRGWFSLPRFGFSVTGLTSDIAAIIEDRAIWAQLGL